MQELLGPDIILAFDEPTSPLHDETYTAHALERTHSWATRCLRARSRDDQALFGIVQGGAFRELRERAAGFVGGLPFDGFSIGGSLGKSKADMHGVLEWSLPNLPDEKPRHLLGIGEPEDLFECVERGIDLFDCVSPTRYARHGVVYTSQGKLSISSAAYRDDPNPIDPGCACYTCQNFSRAYVRHLFAADELLAFTLASIHNLHLIVGLVDRIREAIGDGSFFDLKREWLATYRQAGDQGAALV